MARSRELVRFRPDQADDLLAVLRDLAAHRDGWVNVQADVEDDEEEGGPDSRPGRAGVFALFSGRGPSVPIGTWVPGARTAKGDEPDSLGLQHSAGPRAFPRLRDAGVEPPPGFRLAGDHPKRGLVLEGPPGTDPATLLAWLVSASAVLADRPLPDAWVAIAHRR